MNTEISIINECEIRVTREREPDEEWSGESTESSNYVSGFNIVDDILIHSADLVVGFEIKPDKTYYLVSVIYSTGDSFSHHSGKIDYIELYESLEMAEATKKMILDSYALKDKEESYSVEILNNAGTPYKISSSSWVGYFESLEDVQIDAIKLKL